MAEENIHIDSKSSSGTGAERGRRVIIAGGGTGGHIFPAIAIANALIRNAPDIEVLFVGAKGKMEMEKVPQAGFHIRGIDIEGFNRSSLIKNIWLPFKIIKSIFQVRKIVRSFKPDAVIGVGGYSSFPVLRFAQAKRIPTFIHEANSYAGKTNILLGKKATKVFVATDGMEKFFPSQKTMITGNPVRAALLTPVNRDESLAHFGLNPVKRTVLASGGSLGAKGINEAIESGIDEFEKNDVQLIWQTGKPFADKAKVVTAGRKNIWTNDFITKMEFAYGAADIVISRAGAMAIAELCVVKKPVVFVPFPFAAENHQTVNAQNLVAKNAGLMIRDDEAKEKLVNTAMDLIKNEKRQEELKANIGKLAITDADEVVAKEILEVIKKQK
ncbi:MAG TPA: undecaprenyldiphospho-muramoylpentapeptide beta-N-acetylglucosaminyltransferase [Flavitalea sp.]|nr:undecaprenyldiphospho-muramoylpentapeptide beta-N-acetylglucosaminyltransferase [Flavitalea sp.]